MIANWPGYMREYSERTRRLDPAEYRFAPLVQPAREQREAPAAASAPE